MNVVAVAGQALRRRYALGHGVLVLWRRRVARQAAVHVEARDHLEDDVPFWIPSMDRVAKERRVDVAHAVEHVARRIDGHAGNQNFRRCLNC